MKLPELVVKRLLEGQSLPWPKPASFFTADSFRSDPAWISPASKLYDAGQGHADFAIKYVYPNEEPERAKQNMLKDGWVRLRTHPPSGIIEIEYLAITPEQKSLLNTIVKNTGLVPVDKNGNPTEV